MSESARANSGIAATSVSTAIDQPQVFILFANDVWLEPGNFLEGKKAARLCRSSSGEMLASPERTHPFIYSLTLLTSTVRFIDFLKCPTKSQPSELVGEDKY
ncbi:hypothetical protein NC652_025972 [Populus alba x Populus x berolinensis]|nr:hypothetical protein NC652_025972 [Populus alba x Populus x berolinensis]